MSNLKKISVLQRRLHERSIREALYLAMCGQVHLGWWMVVTIVRPVAASRFKVSTSMYDVDESSPARLQIGSPSPFLSAMGFGATRGGLVKEDDGGIRDHLDADAHSLPLAPRHSSVLHAADPSPVACLQTQLTPHIRNGPLTAK